MDRHIDMEKSIVNYLTERGYIVLEPGRLKASPVGPREETGDESEGVSGSERSSGLARPPGRAGKSGPVADGDSGPATIGEPALIRAARERSLRAEEEYGDSWEDLDPDAILQLIITKAKRALRAYDDDRIEQLADSLVDMVNYGAEVAKRLQLFNE